jgi:hypothetical protein
MKRSLDDVPRLLSFSRFDDSDSEDRNELDSEGEADDEWEYGGEDDGNEDDVSAPRSRHTWVRGEIEAMYAHRYEMAGDTLPRGPAYLPHVLTTLKQERPDHFRDALRVSPTTFDIIVNRIEHDPVFTNNSTSAQMPIETQLAIALYRFGHDGDAASMQNVANWAGISKGIVHIITRRVMTAILRPEFTQTAVRFPTSAEKKEAKKWVQAHSCRAWRDGWCFVDGTLVPLTYRPFWFGESYFDRKCNYSLNIQVFLFYLQSCLADISFYAIDCVTT